MELWRKFTNKKGKWNQWIKLRNVQLCNFYTYVYIVRVIKCRSYRRPGFATCTGRGKYIWNFSCKTEGTSLLVFDTHWREDNIKLDMTDLGYGDVDWANCSQYFVERRIYVIKIIHFILHRGKIFLTTKIILNFSRKILSMTSIFSFSIACVRVLGPYSQK